MKGSGYTFRTTCKIAGVDGAVAEFFIGHSIDSLGYAKSPWVYPEHFRKQYQLVEPYLCGEELWLKAQEEKRKEFEDRIQSLEASLSHLTTQLAQQVSAQHQSRTEDTSSGTPKKIKAEEVDKFVAEGWEPVMTLPDGRIVMKAGSDLNYSVSPSSTSTLGLSVLPIGSASSASLTYPTASVRPAMSS